MNVTPVRPPGFNYPSRNTSSELFCEQIPLGRIAQRFGTPAYIYSQAAIHERYRLFDAAFENVQHTVCYSVKANSNLRILSLLAKLGAGFDVVSGGELARVLRAAGKRAAGRTVFSGVGKTADEMDAALKAGILVFNIESEGELRLLARRARALRKRAAVALRLNPDVAAETHAYISTGRREHKFGVPIDDALRLYRMAKRERFLDPIGVSVHIGSQITSMQPFAAAVGRISELVRELRAERIKISLVDAGGGLGIPYDHAERDFAATASAYAEAVSRPLRGLDVHLLLEPGRAIIGPAGVLLTRILYIKQNGNKRFVVCDAAMNDLLRPALYQAFHEIVPVATHSVTNESGGLVDVVGPVCETGDFLARDRNLPQLKEGDLLAVLDAGAYGMALASNYNSRPRPAEVLVDRSNAKLIRKRETLQAMLAAES